MLTKSWTRLIPTSVVIFLWTLLPRINALAQDADDASEDAPTPPVDLDPQLTEGADQVTDVAEKIGLGNIPYAPFLLSIVATLLIGLVFYLSLIHI